MSSKMRSKCLFVFIFLILLASCRVNNKVINPTAVLTTNTPVFTIKPSPLNIETIRISFVGDCMFGFHNELDLPDLFPHVYESQDSVTYPFDNVLSFFKDDDITVINYEGTLTNKVAYADKPWRFRGKPEYASILKESNVEIALVANNHAYDYLEEGYNNTKNAIVSNGVQPIGHNEVYKVFIKGIEFVFIAANFILVEDDNVMHERYQSVIPLIEQNKKDNNIVIVNLHWGKEKQTVPSIEQQDVAHLYVDSGADLIVGHHPHVLQGIEYYKDSYIAYSLGNFAFGGTRSAIYPESMIFVHEWKVLNNNITDSNSFIVPCYITSTDVLNVKGNLSNNYRPIPLEGDNKQKCINLIFERSRMMHFGIENILTIGK